MRGIKNILISATFWFVYSECKKLEQENFHSKRILPHYSYFTPIGSPYRCGFIIRTVFEFQIQGPWFSIEYTTKGKCTFLVDLVIGYFGGKGHRVPVSLLAFQRELCEEFKLWFSNGHQSLDFSIVYWAWKHLFQKKKTILQFLKACKSSIKESKNEKILQFLDV